ncbi:MAG: hypothetical protein MJE68_13865 [Proteobacteria bacterium]|nr:hypothetical protein [Pseudomonadota bacterium]
MLSGRRLDLLDPTPLDIEIEDIAHGLSRLARWNGQTKGAWAWSVAQHALLVEALFAHANPGVAARWRQAALLHDAAEYVIGDMITPFKTALGVSFMDIEEDIIQKVHIRFGLPAKLPAKINQEISTADRTAAYLEAVHLAGFSETEARLIIAKPAPAFKAFPSQLVPHPPNRAKADFLAKFEQFNAARQKR